MPRATRLPDRTAAVPTNEQRRATAKRKLERQLERREAQARKRRILTIIAALGTVLAAGYLLWLFQRTAMGEPAAVTAGDHMDWITTSPEAIRLTD